MKNDPIVEEIHKIREAYAATFNFDLKAIFADLKAKERQSSRLVVKRAPERFHDEGFGLIKSKRKAVPADFDPASLTLVTWAASNRESTPIQKPVLLRTSSDSPE